MKRFLLLNKKFIALITALSSSVVILFILRHFNLISATLLFRYSRLAVRLFALLTLFFNMTIVTIYGDFSLAGIIGSLTYFLSNFSDLIGTYYLDLLRYMHTKLGTIIDSKQINLPSPLGKEVSNPLPTVQADLPKSYVNITREYLNNKNYSYSRGVITEGPDYSFFTSLHHSFCLSVFQ